MVLNEVKNVSEGIQKADFKKSAQGVGLISLSLHQSGKAASKVVTGSVASQKGLSMASAIGHGILASKS